MAEPRTIPCKVPFAHDPASCDCRPSQLDIDAARFERSAALRAEMAKQARWKLITLAVAVPLISFVTLYGIAAVVDAGRSNLKSWMVANEPV